MGDRPVEGLEDDRDEIVAVGAFDLLEGLNVVVFRAVDDAQDLSGEPGFVAGPAARRASIVACDHFQFLLVSD